MNTRLQSVTIFRNNIIDNDLAGSATFASTSGEVRFQLSTDALYKIVAIATADIHGTMNELFNASAVQTTNDNQTGERSEQVQSSPTWDSFAEFRLKRQQAIFKNIEQPTK